MSNYVKLEGRYINLSAVRYIEKGKSLFFREPYIDLFYGGFFNDRYRLYLNDETKYNRLIHFLKTRHHPNASTEFDLDEPIKN